MGDNEFELIIKQAYSQDPSDGSMKTLMSCIFGCGLRLKSWNKTHFGQVRQRLATAERKLIRLKSKGRGVIEEDIREAQKEMHIWMERDEIMWRQRSRVQ